MLCCSAIFCHLSCLRTAKGSLHSPPVPTLIRVCTAAGKEYILCNVLHLSVLHKHVLRKHCFALLSLLAVGLAKRQAEGEVDLNI